MFEVGSFSTVVILPRYTGRKQYQSTITYVAVSNFNRFIPSIDNISNQSV